MRDLSEKLVPVTEAGPEIIKWHVLRTMPDQMFGKIPSPPVTPLTEAYS